MTVQGRAFDNDGWASVGCRISLLL